LAHVVQIAVVTAFDLGQGLTVEIIVVEIELAVACDEDAALALAGQLGNEIGRSSELEVDLQLFLERMERLEKPGRLRLGMQVDIDRHLAPAMQDGGNSAREIDAALVGQRTAQLAHKVPDVIGLGFMAHGIG
jgi:hypothetical protein